jgi:TPR repeat protein
MNLMKTTPLVGVLALMAAIAVAAPALEEQYRQASADFYKTDKAEALKKLLPLAEQGHAGAQQKVAVLYLGGGGVARDLKQVAKWYGKAAEAGNLDAQFQLATAYREGLHGLPKDHALALKWFRAAADQGYAAANLSLAVMYQNGWGTEKNLPESFRLASLAANQHNADAQVHIGRMYEKGEGVAQSHTEAAKWYRKAADLGSYLAKSYLKSLPVAPSAQVSAPSVQVAASPPPEMPAKVLEAAKPAAVVPAATPVATVPSAPQKTLVHTPITDPIRLLAERNSQTPPAPAAVSDSDFDLDKAPAAERGKSAHIVAGKPEYGFKYTDANGWYTFIMPTGWRTELDQSGVRMFIGKSGKNEMLCMVAPLSYRSGLSTLTNMQAASETALRAAAEKQTRDATEKVTSRGELLLGGDGWPKRTPVKMLAWNTLNSDQGIVTAYGAVETPAVTLAIGCGGRPEVEKTAQFVIKTAFRLAEGTRVPASVAVPRQTTTVNTAPAAANTAQGTLAEALRLEEQGNHAKAFSIYKSLADKGDALAQFKVGVAYGLGRGVAKDKAQEMVWYRKSAEQGNASAQGLLGTVYMHGEGVPLDKTQAYMWLRLAAPADTLYEYNRSLLALQLNSAELDKAEKLASACKAKSFRNCGTDAPAPAASIPKLAVSDPAQNRTVTIATPYCMGSKSDESYQHPRLKAFRDHTSGKCGYKDLQGNVVIPAQYGQVMEFGQGVAIVGRDSGGFGGHGANWGLIDESGKILLPLEHTYIRPFRDGLARVNRGADALGSGGKWGFVTAQGKFIVPMQHDSADDFSDGLAPVRLNGKCGYINSEGKVVVAPRYVTCHQFREGLAAFNEREIDAAGEGLWGFLDRQGKVVIAPSYQSTSGFSEGLSAVKYGGRWGYIDKAGNVKIRFVYAYAQPFEKGVATVAKPGRKEDAYIDSNGQEVSPFANLFK